MAEPAERLKMTAAEYLAYERSCSEAKHEYVDGELFAMSGGTREHSLIGANIVRELGNALADTPCKVHGSDMRVGAANGSYHYPDASVVCERPRFEDEIRDVLLNPSLIVEVLSDSTERYDRAGRFAHFRTIESLTDYVLVSQHAPLVEHYRRLPDGAWRYRPLGPGESLELGDHGASIALERIYLKVFATG
jgi:Uma2 family endonuclease